FHRGHEHVIEVARRSVEHVDVVVFAGSADAIFVDVRAGWIRERFPDVAVSIARLDGDAPTPARFAAAVLYQAGTPDYLFSSEHDTAKAAAAAIGATYVPVDPARSAIATSATAIRAD